MQTRISNSAIISSLQVTSTISKTSFYLFFNKLGTAQVGAPLKVQKEQCVFSMRRGTIVKISSNLQCQKILEEKPVSYPNRKQKPQFFFGKSIIVLKNQKWDFGFARDFFRTENFFKEIFPRKKSTMPKKP